MQYNITYRQKDGGWQYIISYKQNGKWKQKSKQGFKGKHSKGKTDCQNAAIKMVEELEKIVSLDTDAEYKDITFKELVQDFINHEIIYKENNTIRSYKIAFKAYKGLNDKLIIDVSLNDIQDCTDKLCEKGMKATTVLKYLAEIKLLFDYAVKKKIILISPIELKNIEVSKMKLKEKRVLNQDEITDLLSKIKIEKYYLISLIAVFCGCRIGEILGLTVNDIDTENNTINVNKQWKKLTNNKYGMGDLKTTNSYRIIPTPSFVIQKIKNYIDKRNLQQLQRLFPYKSTNAVSSNLRIYYSKICDYNISVHELRHTYITTLHASNQLDVKTIAVLAGHTVQQDLKKYAHFNDDMRKNAATKIKNIFDEFLTNEK